MTLVPLQVSNGRGFKSGIENNVTAKEDDTQQEQLQYSVS
jgi:hypothetical protein